MPVTSPSLISKVTGSLINPSFNLDGTKSAYLPGDRPKKRKAPFGPDCNSSIPQPPLGKPSPDTPSTATFTPSTGRPVSASTTRPETSRVSPGSETVMSTLVASDPSLTSITFASDSLVALG